MKKKIFGFAAALLLTVGLAACGNNSDSKDSANKADDIESRRFTDTARRDFGTCETIIER